MNNILKEYTDIVLQDMEKNTMSFDKAKEFIKNSTAYYHGKPIPFLYIPKIFTEEVYDYLKEQTQIIYKILSKVINEYLNNEDYRKLFNFSPVMEKLILSQSGYECALPITRIDLFLNEETLEYKFCEFNTDGTSAMNEDRELVRAISETYAFKEMSKKYDFSSFELFDSWIEEFMKIYSQYKYKVENPFIVIADFMESATPNEFKIFKEHFIKNGYDADIVDVRELILKEDGLYCPGNRKVDVIYRRAVSGEVERKADEADDLIQAALNNKVCLIGHFKTQVVHNKLIFKILNMEETFSFLDEKEIEFIKMHVPYTTNLEEGKFNFKEVAENKEKWIIKPGDLYASMGVYAGIDMPKDKWEEVLKENMNKDYILQEYCPPYKSVNTEFTDANEFFEYNNLLGMYVYNGKLKGFFSRAGRNGIIADAYQGRTIPTFLAK